MKQMNNDIADYAIKAMDNTIIAELNTDLIRHLFNGTYYTIWEVYETNEEGTEELATDYNFQEFMKSIAQAYQDNEKMILSEMGVGFIRNIKFTGTFYSPREYNFKTDSLDFSITLDKEKLYKTLDSLAENEEFDTWLHDNYSSRDGFISFTPDNYDELQQTIKQEADEFDQALGALITYLMEASFKYRNITNTIEQDVYEDWSGNSYYGLNYTIVEDEK